MGDEYQGIEQRKESSEMGKQLARIETILDAMKEQLSTRFESVKNWQSRVVAYFIRK